MLHNSTFRIALLTAFCFLGLSLSVSIKTYIITVLLYGSLVFLLTKLTIQETLFMMTLVVLPFEKGLRDWTVAVVPRGTEYWQSGYSMYFGVSLKMIFSYTLALMLLFQKRQASNTLSSGLLLAFLAWSVISSLVYHNTFLTQIGLLRIIQDVLLYMVALFFFQSKTMKNNFIVFCALLLLGLGVIGALQTFSGHPIGLFIEEGAFLRPLGYNTTDGDNIYRVSGVLGHPTFFGSLLSLLIPITITIILQTRLISTWGFVLILTCILGCISAIGTFSRSTWISVGTSVMAIGYVIRKQMTWIKTHKVALGIFMLLILCALILNPFMRTRMENLLIVWSLGSGKVRVSLMEYAWKITLSSPMFGVGLNQFTQALTTFDLPINLKGFIYPVHNTFLLFVSELGIPAGILFITFVLTVLTSSYRKTMSSKISLGVWIGACTFLINSQFHTLFNQDPTLDMFMILLAYLATL